MSQQLIQPLMPFNRPAPTLLAKAGDMLRRYRGVIVGLQWLIVIAYVGLVTVPAMMPLPPADGRMLHNLTLFAQFVFWGI